MNKTHLDLVVYTGLPGSLRGRGTDRVAYTIEIYLDFKIKVPVGVVQLKEGFLGL